MNDLSRLSATSPNCLVRKTHATRLALRSPWWLLAILCCLTGLPTLNAQSARPGWGSLPYRVGNQTGVTFRVWAPNASSVTVPGQFNGWSTTANPLVSEITNGAWSADIPGALPAQEYKYFINDSIWKRDPRNHKCVTSSGGNSIIYDTTAFDWTGDSFTTPPIDDLFIYELHVGTFSDPNPTNTTPGHFSDAITKLDYIKGLGISAVELLPIAEFPGTDSWGYNPAEPFAVENQGYGGPDGLKALVKACHARGLAVLLDVVHNHYGPTDLDIWNYDGWTGGGNQGGIYFYQSNNLCCTPYGPRPNYSRQPVRDYIQDNFRMWLDEYHVDGFRWDTPGLMMNASGYGTVTEAVTLIQAITAMIHTNYPGKVNIAEDVTGMGFDSTWALGFPSAVTTQLAQTSDSSRDMNVLANQIAGGGAGLTRVVFLESHDVVGDLNNGARLVTAIDSNNPASYWARKRSTLGATLTFTAPGVPMLFQGQEMLEDQQFSSSRPVDWTKTNTYAGIARLYGDLMRLRRNIDGVTPGLKGDQVSLFQIDNSNKLLAWRRWKSTAPTQDAVVIANFANAVRSNYSLSFPRAGNWYVYFNSDSTEYGADYGNVGPTLVNAIGSPPTGGITVGRYSALILSQTPPSSLTVSQAAGTITVSWPTAASGWVLESATSLSLNSAWTQIPSAQYQTNATNVFITAPGLSGSGFFRLRKP
jgi:1,4-alpha-glucan branching enzyme